MVNHKLFIAKFDRTTDLRPKTGLKPLDLHNGEDGS